MVNWKNWVIFKPIKDFYNTFNNKEVGASARKSTGFYSVVVMASYITIRLLPKEDMLYALYAWLVVGLLSLTIITVEQLIKLKNGISKNNTTEEKNRNNN
jgi:hypothetical protein